MIQCNTYSALLHSAQMEISSTSSSHVRRETKQTSSYGKRSASWEDGLCLLRPQTFSTFQNAVSAEWPNSIPQAFPEGMHFLQREKHRVYDDFPCNGDLATLMYKVQHWSVANPDTITSVFPFPQDLPVIGLCPGSIYQRPGLHNTASISHLLLFSPEHGAGGNPSQVLCSDLVKQLIEMCASSSEQHLNAN